MTLAIPGIISSPSKRFCLLIRRWRRVRNAWMAHAPVRRRIAEVCAATRTCSKSCATRAMRNMSRCWAGWAAPSLKSSIGTRPISICGCSRGPRQQRANSAAFSCAGTDSRLSEEMQSQRKFQLLIADIRVALADVARENRFGDLFRATGELVRFEDELAGDIGKVRELIAVARAIRDATGPGRSVAEQKIIDTLKGIAWTCCSVLEEAGVPRNPDLAGADALIPHLRRSISIVAELRDYAMECLRFNARPRDAFAGARRGQSFEILGIAGRLFDLPEALDMARQALRRGHGRSQTVRGAIVFLEDYFKAREGMEVPDDIHTALLTVAETTDSRSTAAGALNALVETGEISDMEALDRLDDWKDKHYR